jgi:GT2 family glycosyltransferase
VTTPDYHGASENDYRGLRSVEPGPEASVALVVPVFERPELLARTLAGVAALEYSPELLEVAVVDDGSTADIKAVVERAALPFPSVYERQEVEGNGAGPARNLGAASVSGDVILFIDADCIPAPDLVARHMDWHRRAANVVVVGNRVDVDAGAVAPSAVPTRFTDLAGAEGAQDSFQTWRAVLHRRTKGLLIGDTAYRACLSNNLSVPRALFEEVGGFSDQFTMWGGEDTELGWRLWNAGAFIVPEPGARVLHQTQDASPDLRERPADRDRGRGLMADLVPQRFYRRYPTPAATVPKVSWIVMVADGDEASRLWREAALATYADAEVLLVGDPAVTSRLTRPSARAGGFGEAVRMARGEVLVIADGRAEFSRRLLARAMNRFDDPRVSAVRVGYRAGSSRVLRLDDLLAIDQRAGRQGGAPLFALVKRRELMKDPGALATPGRAWQQALERSRTALLVTDLVTIPEDLVTAAPGKPGPKEIRASGAEELARGARRLVRAEPAADAGAEATPVDDRVSIDYVGFTEHDNLGDDAVIAAVRRLMPWARIERDAEHPSMLMVGGGTLINGRNYYLTRIQRNDRPNLERAVFGTGVRSPAFWGVTEDMDEWWAFFAASMHVSVRGPDSVTNLRELGYTGPVEIIGDPALSLDVPEAAERVPGRVVVSPVHTAGMLHGGDDREVFAALSKLIARLRAEGRDVVMMTAFPADDRWALEIMRNAGHPDLPYVPGYTDLDTTLELLASADLVVGERLHAVVLAAAVGTPFVAVEYRPKLRDFAASIGRTDVVVRTDEMDRLPAVVDLVVAAGSAMTEETATRVAELRERQRAAAAAIREALTKG